MIDFDVVFTLRVVDAVNKATVKQVSGVPHLVKNPSNILIVNCKYPSSVFSELMEQRQSVNCLVKTPREAAKDY